MLPESPLLLIDGISERQTFVGVGVCWSCFKEETWWRCESLGAWSGELTSARRLILSAASGKLCDFSVLHCKQREEDAVVGEIVEG